MINSIKGIYNLHIFGWCVQLKTPSNKPIFSERNGLKKSILSIKGFRLFAFKPHGHGVKK
jgi:hypothetical protein